METYGSGNAPTNPEFLAVVKEVISAFSALPPFQCLLIMRRRVIEESS